MICAVHYSTTSCNIENGSIGETRKKDYRLRTMIIQLKTAINPENVINVLFSKTDDSAIIVRESNNNDFVEVFSDTDWL